MPGDGKFDQISHNDTMTNVTLCVGRVDLANLPAFPQPECELLRGYLDKDHNFRNKVFSVEERGLIDDQFGSITGLSRSPWRGGAIFRPSSASATSLGGLAEHPDFARVFVGLRVRTREQRLHHKFRRGQHLGAGDQ